jgi:small subunit ribosomal protein S1
MSWGRVSHPSEVFQVGDSVKVRVLKFDPETERVSLGLKQTLPDPWEAVGDRYPIGLRLRGKVVSLADYGAFVELEPGIEGLIHISEMSWTKRVKHPSKVVAIGDETDVIVLDVDPVERKISLGMKQIEPNPWSLLEEKYPPGTRIKGVVRNVTNFGVFVGIDEDGIDGLIHISDISWTQKIRDPKDLYKKGDEVEAAVLKIDKDNEKFSLGVKQLLRNPWEDVPGKYPVGTKITGKVTSVADFGVFIELEEGIEGLVYTSEVGKDLDDIREAVKVGEEVEALVVRVDAQEQKLALSMRAIQERQERQAIERVSQQSRTQKATLGDQLSAELLEKLRGGGGDS